MTPGKLLSEIQVGGAINDARWQLARDAYVEWRAWDDKGRPAGEKPDDHELLTPDPAYWDYRLDPPTWASGTVARLPFGALNALINSHKHDKFYENPFDMPFRFTLANGPDWGQAMYEEAVRATLAGTDIYWYWGKPGIGIYDSLALDIVKALLGTHIVDATNGADGRPDWMPHDWWGEALMNYSGPHTGPTIPIPVGGGQYAFANNVRSRGGAARIVNAIMLRKWRDYGCIISCHEPADFEWLLGTTVTKLVNGPADMPTWEILLKSGISLAFRGDEQKVNADLGGRLSEMKEVAG